MYTSWGLLAVVYNYIHLYSVLQVTVDSAPSGFLVKCEYNCRSFRFTYAGVFKELLSLKHSCLCSILLNFELFKTLFTCVFWFVSSDIVPLLEIEVSSHFSHLQLVLDCLEKPFCNLFPQDPHLFTMLQLSLLLVLTRYLIFIFIKSRMQLWLFTCIHIWLVQVIGWVYLLCNIIYLF